tara:strand:- start:3431 stop:4057 length:627 start_codon:yes stop_codon:yes gene_type:complete
MKQDKRIEYHFFHWGPFLYKTILPKEELDQIVKLCSKKGKDYRNNLAGIIRHEHEIDRKKIFPILAPYFQSYMQAFNQHFGHSTVFDNVKELELKSAWVNYMVKGECNPMHTHDDDLSFVLFSQIPKGLPKEYEDHLGNTKPGAINFIYTLQNNPHLLNQHSFFPVVGEMFIFPASLNHYVNPFKAEGERISISGNIKLINYPKKENG